MNTQATTTLDEGVSVDGLREQRVGNTVVLTLDRPHARNAINIELAQRLNGALDAIEADLSVWAVVLAATAPVFCAGADLRVINEGRIAELNIGDKGFGGFVGRDRRTPVIAAIDGPAFAGGCELVLACDMVVASTASSFALPEVKRGLVAGAGGLFRMGQKVPPNIAMQALLTGDPITAERAAGFGLVNVLCEPGTVLDRALELAGQICVNAPLAVQESRQVAVQAAGSDHEAWVLSGAAMDTVLASGDVVEGVQAFLEKRPAKWTGS